MKRRPNTGLLHPLSWYIKTYGIPEQTIVNAYRRGWHLDKPQELLDRLVRAPGPKTSGLQNLIDFLNVRQKQPAARPRTRRNAPGAAAEPTAKQSSEAPEDHSGKCRIELTIGATTFYRFITPVEADAVVQLNASQSWQTKATQQS
ncbi:MAG: hypothetical protein QOI07_159 [Verrucomicrobiota bacterium]|jgi:hypothetical protein